MNILEAQRTLSRLAKQKGVPTSEIEKEIAKATAYVCEHADDNTKKKLEALFGEEHVPTPAEMLMYLSNEVQCAK